MSDGPVRTAQEGLLPKAVAMSIIEAEIARRGWQAYDLRHYTSEHRNGRTLWICAGVVSNRRGGCLRIEIDGRTGELVCAKAGGR